MGSSEDEVILEQGGSDPMTGVLIRRERSGRGGETREKIETQKSHGEEGCTGCRCKPWDTKGDERAPSRHRQARALPASLQRGPGPPGRQESLISDSWPPESQENTFLLFLAKYQFAVLCHASPWEGIIVGLCAVEQKLGLDVTTRSDGGGDSGQS